jgi:hypothetical protein
MAMAKRRVSLLAGALPLLLAACAGGAPVAPPPGSASAASPKVEPVAWVGRTQQELLADQGEPASVRIRPDGSLLIEYVVKGDQRTCRRVYLADPSGMIAAQKEACE